MSLAQKVKEFQDRIAALETERAAIAEAMAHEGSDGLADAVSGAIAQAVEMRAQHDQLVAAHDAVAEELAAANELIAGLQQEKTELSAALETARAETAAATERAAQLQAKLADPAYKVASIEGQEPPESGATAQNDLIAQWNAVCGTAGEFEFYRQHRNELGRLAMA